MRAIQIDSNEIQVGTKFDMPLFPDIVPDIRIYKTFEKLTTSGVIDLKYLEKIEFLLRLGDDDTQKVYSFSLLTAKGKVVTQSNILQEIPGTPIIEGKQDNFNPKLLNDRKRILINSSTNIADMARDTAVRWARRQRRA